MSLDFAPAILDSLGTHVAVLDPDGRIVYVNRAWADFSLANGGPGAEAWIGRNYLDACVGGTGRDAQGGSADDPWPALAFEGIRSVQSGLRREYSLEYPCHSPTEQRWFVMRVRALDMPGAPRRCVVTHDNITDRILAETRLVEINETDPLTRLSNWRRFERQWAIEWGRGMRLQRTMLLLRVALSDAEPAPAGSTRDAALRRMAAALREQARRPGDLAARAEGASCVLLLAGAALDDTPAVLQAMRLRLAGAPPRAAADSVGPWAARTVSLVPRFGVEPAQALAHAMQRLRAPEPGDGVRVLPALLVA